ncbi:S9 family peptidase [uncultured Marinococcus sp.]|uniref:alpha/beta hydrolase family protein n=1 Tax=uncultured Marinococcus sp. TaxID=487012 RepID=UPI0026174992|nr:alpha/beta hydrolase [uncultured Marinococcus sp.]
MERIYYGDHPEQFGDLRLPEGEGPFPLAIVIHGGFWRMPFGLDIIQDAAEDLTREGIATWNIEYRRVGHEGGGWPGTFNDVGRAADYVRELAAIHPIDVRRVFTIGHSAGGQLALWLAARPFLPATSELSHFAEPLSIHGAVSLAGVLDMHLMHEIHDYRNKATDAKEPMDPVADLLGGSPDEFPERYTETSPFDLIPIDVPQILVHGALDVNVPVGISAQYHQAAKIGYRSIRYLELPDAEHFMLTDIQTDAWSLIKEEIHEMLSL